jgi:DNA helicase-2/ATP-dependent DNA helicase PcrA
LEFPVVFIVAIEEGLLPHERSRAEMDQLEEERRLFFVGITRAREELHLSMAKYRSFRGQSRMAIPSPFLMQLPTEEMEVADYSWAAPAGASVVRGFPDPAHDPTAGLPDFTDANECLGQTEETFGQTGGTVARPYHNNKAPQAGPITPQRNGVFRVTTAAELSATAHPVNERGPVQRDRGHQTPDNSFDSFHHGMLVRHPEYGLGKILALSGSGVKRTATVAFAQGAGEKRFILAHSKLAPAKNGD